MAVCPRCSQENPQVARFCMSCGTGLLAEPPAEAEERKTVTVLFCDLVGFTALADEADPEDVKATLRPYHAELVHEIQRFGGTLEKFIGDAVMAVFGAPVAHEDDAERAVRSGLAIVEAIEGLNESNPTLQLAIRIGVNTGEAVVTLGGAPGREGLVTGDVVNTASRLQQVAPVGGVIIGEATYRATKELFEYEQRDSVRVKGKREPVRIWRAKAVRSRYGPGVSGQTRTSFVGREHELEVLKRTYFRASREPSVQLITIMGEPGVGKSRLAREFFAFIDDLPDLVFWRQGRCLPYGEGITFWPLGQIVKAQAGILESDEPREASSKLAAAVRGCVDDQSEQEWLKARLAPLVGLAQPEAMGASERLESFTAWRRFLEAMATIRPLVLVFDDLHWGDDALVEFLEHLVDWSHDLPMIVVCTARPELYERHPRWGGGKRNAATITLSPLTDDEMAQLIAALSLDWVRSPYIDQVVREQAEGNPLYAEEFLAMLGDRNQTPDLSLSTTTTAMEIPFPESIHAIIAARLDALSPQQKSLLQDAAVVGKVFWSGALSLMSGIDESVVRDTLHELTRKELVRPAKSSSVKDQAEYVFWHILIRDVAYGQIPRLARGRKHRAVAEWAERVAGERAADVAEVLAYHYWQALELARSAGATEEALSLEEPTRRFTVMAGDWVYGLDVARALEHYQQALELLPSGHPERGRVLAKAGEAAARAGRFATGEQAYQEAIAEFHSRRDPRSAGDTMVKLSNLLWHHGHTAKSREVLTEAIQLLQQEGPRPELANAYTEMAAHLLVQGQLKEALELLDRALALARDIGVEDLVPRALGFRGAALCELGNLEGLHDLRTALAQADRLGLGREAARIHGMLAESVWLTEGPAGALELSRAGIELAEHRGNVDLAMALRAETLRPLFDLGEWDQLLRVANQVVRWSGERYFAVAADAYQARVFLSRGEASRAISLVETFLPLAREIGDPQILVTALIVAALAQQARHDTLGAVGLIEELEQRTVNDPSWYRAQHVADLARISVATEGLELADRLLAGIEVHARRHELSLLTARAVLEEAYGNLEAASDLYRNAAGGWRDFGFLLEEGEAELGAGRCLLQQRRSEAVDALQRAQAIFARLGARPLLEQTEQRLQQSALSAR